MKAGIKTLIAISTVLALSGHVLMAAADAPRVAAPNSNAFGKSLTEWLGIYWAWYYGGEPASGVVDGMMMMPLPASEQLSGSWSAADPAYLKGSIEVTVKAGTPFVLPLFAWVGERYNTGQADDPPMSNEAMLAGLTPTLEIDGKTLITKENEAAFYIPPTYFPEPVIYPVPSSYGSIAALFYQSVGFVSPPLPVGKHVIKLYAPAIFPPGVYDLFGPSGMGLIYDNTWEITVEPK